MIVLGYLFGSIPSGFLMGFSAGIDIRSVGSGNIGATNVARVVGKKQGLLTLLLDAAKGFLPVVLTLQFGLGLTAAAAAGLASFFGHLYPIFLRFRGGKGVATGLGVFIGTAPAVAVLLLGLFAVVAVVTRRVSVGSMTAAGAAPIALWSLSYEPVVVAVGLTIGVMIVLRHHENIRRLLAGTEPKFQLRT